MPAQDTPPAGPPSPRPPWFGCFVGIAGLLYFAGLIAWSLWQGYAQNKAIDAFTVPAPVVQPVTHLDQPAAAALQQRLAGFADALDSGSRTELALGPADLNHLIASDDRLADLRGQLSVNAIDGRMLRCSISYPLNGQPWENRKRYLIGTLLLEPEFDGNRAAFRVAGLDVPGHQLPDWFLKGFSIYHLLEKYQQDPVLSARARQLSAFTIENRQLVLRSKAWKETQ